MNLSIIFFLFGGYLFISSDAKKGLEDPGEDVPAAESDVKDVLNGEDVLTEVQPESNDISDMNSDSVATRQSSNKPQNSTKQQKDRQIAAELQAKIEAIHKDDPRNPLQLAQRTLHKAFSQFNEGETEIKLTTLLKSLETVPSGKSLLFTFRLFAFMDKNNDYIISDDEFTSTLMGPTAQPEKLIELMFKIQDFNDDGVISRYEFWKSEALSLGINYNLADLWNKVAQQSLTDMDTNQNRLVDLSEYTNFVLFQINQAIVQQRIDLIK